MINKFKNDKMFLTEKLIRISSTSPDKNFRRRLIKTDTKNLQSN